MFGTVPYSLPKPEEKTSIARNRLNVFGYSMTNAYLTGITQIFSGIGIYSTFQNSASQSSLENIILGSLFVLMGVGTTWAGTIMVSESISDEREEIKAKKDLIESMKTRDHKTKRKLIKEKPYLIKWAQNFEPTLADKTLKRYYSNKKEG